MATGSVKTLIVCMDSSEPAAPCPAGQAPVPVQSYTLEPSAGSYFEQALGAFDYESAAAFWSVAFVFTISLYLGTRLIGSVVNMTR